MYTVKSQFYGKRRSNADQSHRSMDLAVFLRWTSAPCIVLSLAMRTGRQRMAADTRKCMTTKEDSEHT